ncbi:helix-turn-helix domain-containing protein [Streptomyces venezuelae]|uniref:helix-turn-helix domain-containing protein n=1 Tax=Streptomyces venezuelae TaxID=54571 RepID=UPI003EBBC9BF
MPTPRQPLRHHSALLRATPLRPSDRPATGASPGGAVQSAPLRPSPTCGLRPVHRRILELLATGVNDETIAELLGVSRRTLTRFQMALYAARKGWI